MLPDLMQPKDTDWHYNQQTDDEITHNLHKKTKTKGIKP